MKRLSYIVVGGILIQTGSSFAAGATTPLSDECVAVIQRTAASAWGEQQSDLTDDDSTPETLMDPTPDAPIPSDPGAGSFFSPPAPAAKKTKLGSSVKITSQRKVGSYIAASGPVPIVEVTFEAPSGDLNIKNKSGVARINQTPGGCFVESLKVSRM